MAPPVVCADLGDCWVDLTLQSNSRLPARSPISGDRLTKPYTPSLPAGSPPPNSSPRPMLFLAHTRCEPQSCSPTWPHSHASGDFSFLLFPLVVPAFPWKTLCDLSSTTEQEVRAWSLVPRHPALLLSFKHPVLFLILTSLHVTHFP